jgi:lysophospholipase L1-like esterase
MMRSLLLLVGLVVAALPSSGAAAAPAASPDCRVPPELIEDDPRLPALAQRLRDKQPVTIVAIGGASTAGLATGNAAEASYPSRLQAVLRGRHPEMSITVLNKGVSRQTTQEMVDRFPRDVFALSPTLVIWETGTFDAARGVDVDVFASALAAGLAELREHKLEIMLIDMQYSRSTASIINFEPYLSAMQHIADVDDVYVFRRFEMMKYWSETGVFSFAEVPKERRATLAAEVYECLAERLADAIEYAAR